MSDTDQWFIDAAKEPDARLACWEDCRAGNRPEQAGETYTRCTDPRVCHGWREYLAAAQEPRE